MAESAGAFVAGNAVTGLAQVEVIALPADYHATMAETLSDAQPVTPKKVDAPADDHAPMAGTLSDAQPREWSEEPSTELSCGKKDPPQPLPPLSPSPGKSSITQPCTPLGVTPSVLSVQSPSTMHEDTLEDEESEVEKPRKKKSVDPLYWQLLGMDCTHACTSYGLF